MTTCTWSFRRHAGRVTVVALSAALTSGLVLPSASADQISSLRAQAAAVSSRLQSLGFQEDALAERYDQAQLLVAQAQGQVQAAGRQLATAEANVDRARQALKADAIQAYVQGGVGNVGSAASTSQSADDSLLRAEYVNTLATNQSDSIDQFHLATLQEQTAATAYRHQEDAAQAQLAQVVSDRKAVEAVAAQLKGTYDSLNGQIATLVAQQQAAQALAAQRAAEARLAQEQQQQRQAAAAQAAAAQAATWAVQAAPSAAPAVVEGPSTAPVATVSAPSSAPLPPVGSGASGAVSAAESRIGDWYQWGASGPNTFDCSGLVMWAYAQVGISLPHFSGAQYADTTHIPMSDLEPGDLVFFSDPSQHVAMYIGNGEIVEAAHTGTQVHITGLYPEFTLAGRVR